MSAVDWLSQPWESSESWVCAECGEEYEALTDEGQSMFHNPHFDAVGEKICHCCWEQGIR